MKIGIDARLIQETGVGRYIQNLLSNLGVIDERNRYIVYLRPRDYSSFSLPNRRWEKRYADVWWHSAVEQCRMPWYYLKDRLDIVHTPYFNAPIFYPGKYIVTVHDLTILHFATGKATTLPLVFYKLRRLGYLVAITVGLRRAAHILVPSHTTKQEIVDHLGISPEKITVTYEGVDLKTKNQEPRTKNIKRIINEPYFLYVGNAYPHKNLEMLLRAFQQSPITNQQSTKTLKLVLVGKKDFFYRRLEEHAKQLGLFDRLVFFGHAHDWQLQNLYQNALALVFPSRMEGFGLPALEALANGCPVMCSDIPVFHEILGDNATYFNPYDPGDLQEKMDVVLSQHFNNIYYHSEVRKRTKPLLAKYNWRTMALNTLTVYREVYESSRTRG